MKTNATKTSRKSFAETERLRATEKIRMRQYFMFKGSDYECCRTELTDAILAPINHVTRCVYDLVDDNFLEVRGKKISPTSGRTVEAIGMVEKGLPSKSRQNDTGFKHISEIIPICLQHLNDRMEAVKP